MKRRIGRRRLSRYGPPWSRSSESCFGRATAHTQVRATLSVRRASFGALCQNVAKAGSIERAVVSARAKLNGSTKEGGGKGVQN
ncbi:hypothetical protein NDU88_009113 [Pleurodeles waltl]|uniref:Uncharacterized protein n=1 Tax=Pleurodeles waltl TaxID=8319 RepID=A0AAV7QRY7_PLEWA|nr:hypothetical protein NDU88_009113 [Pleurodeles waltl]